MSVLANLVIGADGSTTFAGSSKSLSGKADRDRFHKLRESAQVILIGGNTARSEPYAKTPTRLIVISRSPSKLESLRENPKAEVWSCSPIQALERIKVETEANILVEGGPALLKPLLEQKCIDDLFLTKSVISGGENRIDLANFFDGYKLIESEIIGADEFSHFKPER